MILVIHRYSDFQTPLFYKVEEVSSYHDFSYSSVQRLSDSIFCTKWRKSAATMILVIHRYSDVQTPLFYKVEEVSSYHDFSYSSVQRLSDSIFCTKWRKSAATMILVIHRYSDFQTPLLYKVEEVSSYHDFSYSSVQRLSDSTFSRKWRKSAATRILVIHQYSDFQTPLFLRSGGSQQLPGF